MRPLTMHKAQPRLRAEMRAAGVTVREIAEFWGIAPCTAKQRLSGLSGMTLVDLAKASAYCETRRREAAAPPAPVAPGIAS